MAAGESPVGGGRPEDEREAKRKAQNKAWIETAPAWVDSAFKPEQLETLPAVAIWAEAVLMAVSKRSDSGRSDDSMLSPTEKVVCMAIAEYARPGLECWPSIDRLALDVGSDRKTVRAARDRLEDTGWLRIDHDRKPKRLYLILPTEVRVMEVPYGPRLARSVTLTTDPDLATPAEPIGDSHRRSGALSVTLNTDLSSEGAISDSQLRSGEQTVALTTGRSVTLNTEKQPRSSHGRSNPATEERLSNSVQDARAWDESISHDEALSKLVDVFTTDSGERPEIVARHRGRYPLCRVPGCPRRQFGTHRCHVHPEAAHAL